MLKCVFILWKLCCQDPHEFSPEPVGQPRPASGPGSRGERIGGPPEVLVEVLIDQLQLHQVCEKLYLFIVQAIHVAMLAMQNIVPLGLVSIFSHYKAMATPALTYNLCLL